MSGEGTLSWHSRITQGHLDGYEAIDLTGGKATYIVRRDPDAQRGHQWTLTAVVAGRDDQTRIGFDLKSTAQSAALATRCHACGRFVPFATLEQSGGMGGWRCRDRAACDAVEARKAALAEQVSREIRNTDMDDVAVTDREDGPALVLTQHGTRQVTQCTENDLLRLAVALLDRWRGRPGFPGALADEIDRAGSGLRQYYESKAGIPWRMS
jgi:hypothetical protein